MSVSNSVDFTLSAGELIEEARSKIGIHADEEPMAAHELVRGLRTLNMMLKSWQADGVMCWTLEEGQFTLAQSQASYAFGAGGDFTTVPMEIIDARINRGSNDLPMWRMSRKQYFDLPNKTTQGYPTQFYYDRQRSGGTLYVWPAPDSTGGTIKFTYRRLIMDLDTQADDIDLPQEWHETILYNLADRLAENAGVSNTPEAQKVTARAAILYEKLKAFDVGEGMGSLTIMPDDYGD